MDNLLNNEKILMEIAGDPRYTVLGFFAVPLWLTLLDFKLIRGYSFLGSLKIAFKSFFSNPYMLGIALILEIIMLVAFIRISKQKLYLTETNVISETGIFKVEQKAIPLKDIKIIYSLNDNDKIARRFKCASVALETLDGDKQSFMLMKNTQEFTDKANYQIARLKREAK